MDADADLLRYFATPIVFVTDAVRIRRFDPRDQVFAHQITAVVHPAESAQRAILQRDWPNFVPQGLTILSGARLVPAAGDNDNNKRQDMASLTSLIHVDVSHGTGIEGVL